MAKLLRCVRRAHLLSSSHLHCSLPRGIPLSTVGSKRKGRVPPPPPWEDVVLMMANSSSLKITPRDKGPGVELALCVWWNVPSLMLWMGVKWTGLWCSSASICWTERKRWKIVILSEVVEATQCFLSLSPLRNSCTLLIFHFGCQGGGFVLCFEIF